MLDGEFTGGPLYTLACIQASSDGLKLAKISNDNGVEFATAPTVFLGGFASRFPPAAPASIPSGLARCRDLVVAAASRTIRTYGHETHSGAGPVIGFPLHFYQWKRDGTVTGALVDEAEGVPAERRHYANSVADEKSDELRGGVYNQILTGLESNGLLPDEVVSMSIDLPKVTINARRSGSDAPKPATDPVTETPTETPPSAT